MKKKGINLTVSKYKELGFKRFFKKWGEGIEGITPLQQTKTILISVIVVIFALFYGVIVTLIGKTYWLSIILVASIPITFMQFVGSYQKYKILKNVEKTMQELK